MAPNRNFKSNAFDTTLASLPIKLSECSIHCQNNDPSKSIPGAVAEPLSLRSKPILTPKIADIATPEQWDELVKLVSKHGNLSYGMIVNNFVGKGIALNRSLRTELMTILL
mmetsp:Transcript_28890/g.41964  ORF Transcript_28890/g.41964 Transcript_28890/m.41964 type:complete len:111 (-) Transcript_28890:345-677(-)